MRALRMLGGGKVQVVDRPTPRPEDDWAVVRIRASAICGSERKSYLEGARYNFGHEACGEIVEVDSPSRVEVGQSVVLYAAVFCGSCPQCLAGQAIMCRNAQWLDGYHMEYVSLPERCLLPLPEDISFAVGSLLGDALGTPYRALKRLGVDNSHTVAVFGLGPIGLAAVLVCKWKGAFVIALESNPSRIKLGRELGADSVVDISRDDPVRSVMELTEGENADVAIDCTGSEKAELAAIDCTKGGGKVAFVGENHGTIPISPSEQFLRKELTLIGSWYFALDDYQEMVRLVESGLPLSRIITHRFRLDQAQQAYDVFMSGEAGKVIFEY